jgi:hypothetical protein
MVRTNSWPLLDFNIDPLIFVTGCILVVIPFSNNNINHGNNFLPTTNMVLEGIELR